MAHVTSQRNGLQIGVPPDARGVISRFRTAGDNELVFNQSKMDSSVPAGTKSNTMKIGDDTPARPQRAARRRSTKPATDLV